MAGKWLRLIALVGLVGGNIICASGEEWKQVFSDDFNRSDVFGPDWQIKDGKWDIRPGNLKANGPGAEIICARRFEAPFRIEYECYSDNPCDLSIELRKKQEDQPACFVGFGSENNTLNKILVPSEGTAAAVSRDKLIEIGRKHKVAVEVGEDGTVKQTIDGQETLKAAVKTLPRKLYFGFYVWNQGAFNSVKVFSPHSGEEAAPEKKAGGTAEKIPTVRQFQSFNPGFAEASDYAAGAITDMNIKAESGEKCSVKIADVPTWLYCFRKYYGGGGYFENEDPKITEPNPATVTNKGARFVSDPCLELLDENGGAGQRAAITFPVPEMRKGLFEFDLMADHYEGDGLRIKLGDKAGLWLDKNGDYYWQAGTNIVRLMERISYPGLRGAPAARFYLQPRRWFTVRIDFDLETSLANVAIVKMYNGFKNPQEEYLLVGEDLPLPMDTIKEARFETCGKGRFFVDNVFMISRTEDLADDTKWRAPAREIMTAYYPLRKDPISLKTWSMHNIRFAGGGGHPAGDELQDLGKYPDRYAVILKSAEKYNEIMVKQAFLGEKMRGLERAWSYAEKTAGDYQGKVAAARQATAKTEELLADLFEFYAACYLDRLNQEKMKDGFEKRHAALTVALESAGTLIQNTQMTLRSEIIKKTQCKFEPYAIESAADTSATRLKFADGAFRRPDGKRDFVFEKMRYLLWPSMEKTLMFSPDCKLDAVHALQDAREPEYYMYSTNSYFYSVWGERPGEQLSLRLFYGMHNHHSVLPVWWFEKHKSDPDIFLQNSKGESSVVSQESTGYADKSVPVWQQYNYWNADVLAAQKATLEGLGDLMVKYGLGERVSYIDMAAEAYYLINGPGGTFESGYNPTAVKAFRERLKKKYESIGALNERWGSKYVSFDAIKPPEDWRVKPERVPGLTYEFERFRQDSWHAWMKQCHVWLRDRLPGKNLPNSCDITHNGGTCVDGLDWVKLFETFDIVMEHYYQQFEPEPILYRYLENLREVFKTSTGIGEWYVSGPGDLFDEQAIRNNGLRQTYQQVQWGRSLLVYWQGHNFMFIHNGNATENRLGHTVLRYSSAFIPLGIARAKAHRAIYQESPLVQPDVGILESESSFYNVWSVQVGSGFGELLFSRGHNYGNLFERLVMEGHQDLDGYKVIIMPNAACLPDKFAEKLLGWVQAGGILLTTGPAGVMNELGVKGGKLPDEVLGAGQWTYGNGKLGVKEGAPGLNVLALDSSKQPALIENDRGKGKVYMCLSPAKDEAVYAIISRHAPRKFYGKDNRFHLVMRDGKKEGLYLSVLNPDCYKQLDDEIVLDGEYKEIADISNNFPILPEIKDGKTSFKLSLAPVEGVMIRIRK